MVKTIVGTTMLVIGTCGALAHGDAIDMKPAVRLAPNTTTITLADVAELDGEEAARFGAVVVATLSPDTNNVTITVDALRSALENAGAHWGRIDLNGCQTIVRITSALAAPPQAMSMAAIDAMVPDGDDDLRDAPTQYELLASQIGNDKSIAAVIAAHVAGRLKIDQARLRLTFAEKDREALDATTSDYRIELEQMSSITSDRATVQARLWKDGVVAERRSIAFGIDIRIDATFSATDLKRGELVDRRDLEEKEIWIGACELNDIIAAETAAGRIPRRNIKAGEMLRQRDLDRQMVIERGDLVQVRCLVGGVAIAMQAEARSPGSPGETIEFRKLGERDSFLARVVSRSEAVVDLGRR